MSTAEMQSFIDQRDEDEKARLALIAHQQAIAEEKEENAEKARQEIAKEVIRFGLILVLICSIRCCLCLARRADLAKAKDGAAASVGDGRAEQVYGGEAED